MYVSAMVTSGRPAIAPFVVGEHNQDMRFEKSVEWNRWVSAFDPPPPPGQL